MKSLFALGLAFASPFAQAAHIGDRHFGDEADGVFYAFSPGVVNVLDAESLQIIKTLQDPDFPSSWSDAVYIRSLDHNRHYVMANDRENHRVIVIDTEEQEVAAKIDVGSTPVHIYAIERREEVWTHNDGSGDFSVIHLSDVENLHHLTPQVHNELAGHGKLLFDPDLGDVAYATNTAEPGIFRFSLDDKEDSEYLPLANITAGRCTGTHGIAWSSVNRHILIECIGPDSYTLDYDVDSGEVVAFEARGQVYNSPDEDFLVAVNKGGNLLHIFGADEDGHEFAYPDITVACSPDKPIWYPTDSSSSAHEGELSSYILFLACTEDEDTTGVAYIDLSHVVNWVDGHGDYPEATIIPAGKVNQGSSGYTYRGLIRGGKFLATPAHSQQGVAIINAETLSSHGVISGIEDCGAIVYAPVHTDEIAYMLRQEFNAAVQTEVSALSTENEDLNNKLNLATAGFAVALVALILALVGLYFSCQKAGGSAHKEMSEMA